MRKLIDIPDGVLKTLKIKAINNGSKSVKNYIEQLLINDAKKTFPRIEYEESECCGAKIIYDDICSECKEHCL